MENAKPISLTLDFLSPAPAAFSLRTGQRYSKAGKTSFCVGTLPSRASARLG